LALAILFCGLTGGRSLSADKQESSFSAILEGKESDVVEALEYVVNDTVIHGSYVYEKEKSLGGAEVVTSSKALGEWQGGGRVYYKICRGAVAPRNFKESADQGTITIRYILKNPVPNRFQIQIAAVYIEDQHRTVHPSNGIVESSEFKVIAEHLRAIQLQEQRDADSKERIDAEIAAKQDLLRRRQEEAAKLADAESSAEDLAARIAELRHKVEMRVSVATAPVKSAPFEAAATLLSLKQSTDVVTLIITPYWVGVETADGHRGWIRKDQLGPLP
jgi:hypothetical protein